MLTATIGFQLLFLIVAVPAAIAAVAIFLCGSQAKRTGAGPALPIAPEGS